MATRKVEGYDVDISTIAKSNLRDIEAAKAKGGVGAGPFTVQPDGADHVKGRRAAGDTRSVGEILNERREEEEKIRKAIP